MILSDYSIKRQLASGAIQVIPPVEDEQIRPTGIRVHLGEAVLVPRPNLVVDLRESRSPKFERVELGEGGFVLLPGGFVLGSTRETVRVEPNLVCHLDGRSTLARLGLFVHCGSSVVDNNNGSGRSVVLELMNGGPFPLRLHAGIAIGLLTFTTLAESIEQPDQQQYDGQLSVTPPDLAFHANKHAGGDSWQATDRVEQVTDIGASEVPSHAPAGYDCPFCRMVAGESTPKSSQDDVIYRDDAVTAFVASEWWPNNPGAVVVVTNQHVENLYGLSDHMSGRVGRVVRLVALAMKDAYGCPGTSTRQHNEPAGGQEVWHYHQHVFPRYPDDQLYQLLDERAPAPVDRKMEYARMLRAAFSELTGSQQFD
jgi:histidine triad (HIT) family protein